MTIQQIIRDYHRIPTFDASSLGIPEHCVFCGTSLDIYPESDVHLWCPNPICSRKLYGNLLKFCEKLDLRSLGVVSLQALADSGSVKTASDLFTLGSDTFQASIPRSGDKAFSNFQLGLKALKETPVKLQVLLAGLNIPFAGEGTWEMLLQAPCFDKHGLDVSLLAHLRDTICLEDWLTLFKDVPRVADRALRSVYTNRLYVVSELEALLQHVSLKVGQTGGKLMGMKFCQTGGLTRTNALTGKRFTRNDLINLIEREGGLWSDTVDKLTQLIIDDVNSTSSKAVKARKCGATLLSEADFFSLVEV